MPTHAQVYVDNVSTTLDMTVPMDQPWEKWNGHRPRLKLDQSDMKDCARVGIGEDYNHEGTVGSVRAEHDGRAWLARDTRAEDFDIERPQMIKGVTRVNGTFLDTSLPSIFRLDRAVSGRIFKLFVS